MRHASHLFPWRPLFVAAVIRKDAGITPIRNLRSFCGSCNSLLCGSRDSLDVRTQVSAVSEVHLFVLQPVKLDYARTLHICCMNWYFMIDFSMLYELIFSDWIIITKPGGRGSIWTFPVLLFFFVSEPDSLSQMAARGSNSGCFDFATLHSACTMPTSCI